MKQIGRKLYHLVGGIGLLSVYYILGRKQALLFYAALFILILLIDGARLVIPAWNRAIFARFGSFIRKNEEHKLTGTAPNNAAVRPLSNSPGFGVNWSEPVTRKKRW